jgi:putative NADH-flavin reductase
MKRPGKLAWRQEVVFVRVAVFGATGRTGQLLVEQALAAGHEVVAFARTPDRVTTQSDRLRVIKGDVQDAARVAEAIAGAEAVISVLGPTGNTPDHRVSQGLKNILAAMTEHGVGRLVISIGAGVRDPLDRPGLFDKAIVALLKLFSRHVYEDMAQAAALVRASDLDWTIVRVPMLTDQPQGDRLRVGYLGGVVGSRVSRADLATFMLGQLDDDSYLRQAPVISN